MSVRGLSTPAPGCQISQECHFITCQHVAVTPRRTPLRQNSRPAKYLSMTSGRLLTWDAVSLFSAISARWLQSWCVGCLQELTSRLLRQPSNFITKAIPGERKVASK